MLIHLADTISREILHYNEILPIRNHLESYWVLRKRKKNIDTWSITGANNENKKKGTTS